MSRDKKYLLLFWIEVVTFFLVSCSIVFYIYEHKQPTRKIMAYYGTKIMGKNGKDQKIATPQFYHGKKYSYVVKGVRYTTLEKVYVGWDRIIIASWYGNKFHGKRTANGETFNMYSLTAAHKRLPFGTLVKVVNLKNKKEVVVRINDRGPFSGKRGIDLSYAAAKKIKIGVGKVKITVVPKPNK